MRYWTKKEKTKEQVDKQPERKLFILLAILAITFVSFSSILNNGFLNWDDNFHLVGNRSVRFFDIKHMFTSTVNENYIPLTILSFAIEHHFFGLNPFIYRLDNLLLHLVVTGLVFLFALQVGLTVRGATFAALLFGIHPMHVESVAWVTERKDVLYAAFYMGALCSYWRYLEDKRIKSYLLTIVLGMLSILAKPMALSLPLILFVCDWLKGRKFNLKVFYEKVPYFLYIIPIAWITFSLNKRIPGDNLIEGALIWVWTATFYIKKFFSLFIFIPWYSLPKPVSISNFHYASSLIILFFLLICLARYRKNRWLIFASLFYFVSIFLLLRCDISDPHIVADRFMYLPSVGICVLLGVLWERILECANKRGVVLKGLVHFCIIVLFSLMCVKTYFQTKLWKDDVTLWSYAMQYYAKKSESCSLAYIGRGITYNKQGKYDLAMANFNKAILTDPNYALAYNGRGNVYHNQGKYNLAMADYNKALEIFPDNDDDKIYIYRNRGLIYLDQGQYDLALVDYNRALFISPNFVEGYNDRGRIYKRQGNYDLALADFSKALDINPNFADAYNNRGIVWGLKGEYYLALDDLNKAIAINPKYLEAYNNRGLIYRKIGSYYLALDDFNKALEIDPNCTQAKNNREHIYEILAEGRKDRSTSR